MSERRSLNSAMKMTPNVGLNPKALEFIQRGVPGKGTPEPVAKKEPAKVQAAPEVETNPVKEESMDVAQTTEAKEPARPRRSSRAQAAPQPLAHKVTMSVTTRLEQRTADALRRAHLEQKLKGMQPATQQEIIEIAVQGWLRDNGFLE